MAIIADIVESWKQGWQQIFKGPIFGDIFLEDDWRKVTDAIKAVADAALLDPLSDLPENFRDIGRFLTDPAEETKLSVAKLGSSLFDGWTNLLKAAMEQLSVDAPTGPVLPIARIQETIASELARGDAEATKRLAVAIGIVNLVIATGNAASAAAELLSAGTVRTLGEAVQSWIWANGLGGMTSMAYGPQMNTSMGPWLERKFNARAQARIPGQSDLIRMQLREVFLDGRREELVGTEDRPVFDAYMAQLGFSKFWADSAWGAHWVLPSIGQLNEMLFRGVIDEEEWTRFVTFNDFEPSQIPNLQKIIFNPFTRVDVRRMAKFAILDDDDLLQAYADLGNFAPTARNEQGELRAQFVSNPDFTIHKAQALVIFTKVFNVLPELRARFKKGWINPVELLQGIEGTGIPADKARILWETTVQADTPERTAPERELTRAMIARAFKREIISWAQGLFLLQRIGWSLPESELILRLQAEASTDPILRDTVLGAQLTGGRVANIPFDDIELGDF